MKPVSVLLARQAVPVCRIRPDDTVFSALQLLAQHEVGALVVMEGDKLVGVISERDYTRKVALQGKNSKDTQVDSIMTRNVMVVSPSTGTRVCMAIMREKKIRHLPVVDEGRVVGMISIRDILDDLLEEHEFTIAQLESYIAS
ncbi:MAG: CBS domain-containing protein [Burkholderiaceae bacterium]|jgi:CBS domain-containing protein|nr:CBS domain-containing protein [Burkholderiaceae bacterium]MDZ4163466.1 CBS domain-containing protein [Burkholderiales bacterium]